MSASEDWAQAMAPEIARAIDTTQGRVCLSCGFVRFILCELFFRRKLAGRL